MFFSVGVAVRQLPALQRTTTWPVGAPCRLLSVPSWQRVASRVQRRPQWRHSRRWCRAVCMNTKVKPACTQDETLFIFLRAVYLNIFGLQMLNEWWWRFSVELGKLAWKHLCRLLLFKYSLTLMEVIHYCCCNWCPEVFPQTYLGVLLSCNLRKFMTMPPYFPALKRTKLRPDWHMFRLVALIGCRSITKYCQNTDPV